MNCPDIECPILGILCHDMANDMYKGQLKLSQSEVTIYFSMDEEGKLDLAQKRFADFASCLEYHLQEAKEYAVESLLALKNEMNIEADRDPLTAQQFKASMVLQFLSIEPDGTISLYYPDDNLYAKHFFVVVDSANNFIYAEIPS